MTPGIEDAIKMAVEVHSGQRDKGGRPYILHPLSVMMRVIRDGWGESWQIAAVLHDVVEDGEIDPFDIQLMFGQEVGDAVAALTHAEGEPYETYIDRCRANVIARIVKLADIEDNLDPQRSIGQSPRLKERYEKAREVLKLVALGA